MRCNVFSNSRALRVGLGTQKMMSPYSSSSLVRPATRLEKKSNVAAHSAVRPRCVRKMRAPSADTVEQRVKEG